MRTYDASSTGVGRPTKYKPEYAHIAEVMCQGGATDFELARAFGIDESTLYRWKLEHDVFREAIKSAKSLPDDRVERALYHRAIGYSHRTSKIFNEGGRPIVVEHDEHYPPDTAAAFIWLKNRRPMEWRDRREVKTELVDDLDPRQLTTEELERQLESIELERRAERLLENHEKPK